ncbi:MAG TPA: hypothetical protein ENJ56_05525 [Anaerolineae bacterium]|nr:hypothetical protein [Anaerolineae bacterium]
MTTQAALVGTLEKIGVHFVAGQANGQDESMPLDTLLLGLARSDEARMRLALIPVFLKNPDCAAYVTDVLSRLAPSQQNLLRCYYTAAQLLQQKYAAQLALLFGSQEPLPALFADILQLEHGKSADSRLRQLAQRQAQLSGKLLNWYGTYEYAYTRLVRHAEKRMQWQR